MHRLRMKSSDRRCPIKVAIRVVQNATIARCEQKPGFQFYVVSVLLFKARTC
jgi:hypothetical protein